MAQPDILRYLPAAIANVKEMMAHAEAEYPELSNLWAANETAYKDQYLYTMTENGINRWERMLGISPMGTDTLEDRRFRIINRVNAQLPYSYNMLKDHLDQMCGTDGYTMAYEPTTWTLMIRVALEHKKQYDEILNLVTQMIPCNLILDYDLLYNTHIVLGSFTHEQLARYTHDELRSDILT